MANKVIITTTVAAMLALGSSATVSAASKERCYGVVKAGYNDCGVEGKHGCAGGATVDKDPKEWVYMPKGLCDKLAGGSTKPGK